ncbi:hypothetical protein EBZ39_10595 [bacterium]|nr:hypothetical protein [bacterium]
MPSVSKKQHNLMAAVAHNPKFAKKVGIPQSVGKEFNKADKGKQFERGGEMAMNKMKKPMMGMMGARKAVGSAVKTAAPAMGARKSAEDAKQRMQKAMQKKDSAMAARKPAAPAPEATAPAPNMKKGGKVKTKCMAGGGYVRAADGITQKGKTKGKFV